MPDEQQRKKLSEKLFAWIEFIYWHVEKIARLALSESISPWWALQLREKLHALEISNNLGWIGLILTILLLPLGIYNIIRSATSGEGKVLSGINIAKTIGSIALATFGAFVAAGAIYMTAPILFTISATKSLIENGLALAKRLYDRFEARKEKNTQINLLTDRIKVWHQMSPQDQSNPQYVLQFTNDLQELTKLINEKRKSNQGIFDTTHALAQGGTALVGAIFLFTVPPVGVIILFATALYGLLDPINKLGKLFNFISQKIRKKPFFAPFREKSIEEINDEVKNKIKLDKGFHLGNENEPLLKANIPAANPKHGEPGHIHGSDTIIFNRFLHPDKKEKLMSACKMLFENCNEKNVEPNKNPNIQLEPKKRMNLNKNEMEALDTLEKHIKSAKERHQKLLKGYMTMNVNKETEALTLLVEDIGAIIKHTKQTNKETVNRISELKVAAQELAASIHPDVDDKEEEHKTFHSNH